HAVPPRNAAADLLPLARPRELRALQPCGRSRDAEGRATPAACRAHRGGGRARDGPARRGNSARAARPRDPRDLLRNGHQPGGADGTARARHRPAEAVGDREAGKGKKDRMLPLGERAAQWIGRYVDKVRPTLALEPDDGTLFLNYEGLSFGGTMTRLV